MIPDLRRVQQSLCNLIHTIGELYAQCDSPEEVMRLFLDVGDDGRINHPTNRAFVELLETLQPMCGEILGMTEGDLISTDGAA